MKKKKSKDQGYFIEANGGGAQHTGSGGGVDGIHRWFMLWGKHSHGALPAQVNGWKIKERG